MQHYSLGVHEQHLVAGLFAMEHPTLIATAPDPLIGAYFLGRMSGQAEKVMLRACRAFQIRPAPAWIEWATQSMTHICQHYGLLLCRHDPLGELWGVHPDWVWLWCKAMDTPYPSPRAHRLRGRLCGIPAHEIDEQYHTRQGTGAHAELLAPTFP